VEFEGIIARIEIIKAMGKNAIQGAESCFFEKKV